MSKFSFKSVPISTLISAVALPVSLIAFAVFYQNNDQFLAVAWLYAILPGIWIAALFFLGMDIVKRHPWKQALTALLLLVPTVFLVVASFSFRFAFHQLFTFRPLDLQISLPPSRLVLAQKFSVCEDSPCSNLSQTFILQDIPADCCTLVVKNGNNQEHKVETFGLVLNGQTIKLLPNNTKTIGLIHKNTIDVTLRGAKDSYIYVFIFYRRHTPNVS